MKITRRQLRSLIEEVLRESTQLTRQQRQSIRNPIFGYQDVPGDPGPDVLDTEKELLQLLNRWNMDPEGEDKGFTDELLAMMTSYRKGR